MYDLNSSYGCYNNGGCIAIQPFKGSDTNTYITEYAGSEQRDLDMEAIVMCLQYHKITIHDIYLLKERIYKASISYKESNVCNILAMLTYNNYTGISLRITFPASNIDAMHYNASINKHWKFRDLCRIINRSISIDIVPNGYPIFENRIVDMGIGMFHNYLIGNVYKPIKIPSSMHSPFIYERDMYTWDVIWKDSKTIPSVELVAQNRKEQYTNAIGAKQLEAFNKYCNREEENTDNED